MILATKPAVERSSYRWVVCGLLFAATTLNYVDRQILGILASVLERDMGWTEAQYGFVVTAFQAAYAIGLPAFGWLLDRVGTRLGYLLAVTIWSIAAALHGCVNSVAGFAAARIALGLGEAGNFPAAVKSVSEWFAKKERALAIGLFNSGSNAGAILAPLVVPAIALRYGWRTAFVATGALGFFWVGGWLFLYREPHTCDADAVRPAQVPWRSILRLRETWVFLLARFLTDPIWWFYLYWAPKFLHTRHGLGLDTVGVPLILIYSGASAGSVFGGWLSSRLIAKGWSTTRARKTAILTCALLTVPMVFGAYVSNVWAAVAILGLAAAGHQGWAANMFACLADLFPERAVSSVVGITGLGASIGGMMAATTIGFLLQATGSYVPIFVWSGMAYLLVAALIYRMVPRMEPLAIEGI